jgi:hypothetical protein
VGAAADAVTNSGTIMKRFLHGLRVVVINLIVLAGLLGAVEIYFRLAYPPQINPFADNNGLWQSFHAYTMSMAAAGRYRQWRNAFTGQVYPADVATNSLGFNDRREFDYDKPYHKAANERVVLFTSGSAGWGVGATSTDTTVAGRMQYHLNTLQSQYKYTVINTSMVSWIAFQEFLGIELWGESFDPDWIVIMNGHNDAGVGCTYSQGVGNPMFYATLKGYIDGYLFRTMHPVFYRGWLENKLIRYSAAYRQISGREYIPNDLILDQSNQEDNTTRRYIIPTKVGDARGMLAFYVKSVKAMLKLYPDAKYIVSTQPMVNQFTGDFVDIYQYPAGSDAHAAAMTKRDQELEAYLDQHQNEACGVKAQQPSFTYIFGRGAVELERLAQDMRAHGRQVEYYNAGTLFPDAREERKPYFVDPVHISDKGNDVLGRFYAERILASESGQQTPQPK